MKSHHNPQIELAYIDRLAHHVRYNWLTKLFFASFFLLLAVVSAIIAIDASLRLHHINYDWFIITIFGVIAGLFLLYKPHNIRRLLKPSHLNEEINITDYIWLEQTCRQHPDIATQVKRLLRQYDQISFTHLEQIWISLGKYEKRSFTFSEYNASSQYVDLYSIKKKILNA